MTDYDVVLPRLLAERASTIGDRVFLQEIGGPERTFGEVNATAQRWSGALAALGAKGGDFIASFLPNGITGLELFFGINGLGAVEVPVHTEYRGRMLAHVLNTVGAGVAVVSERFLDRFEEIAGELQGLHTIIVPDHVGPLPALPFTMISGRELLAASTPAAPVDARPRDICTVLFTSGTTGPSKGVMISYAQLRASTEGGWPLAHMDAEDCNYLVLPGFHISGKVALDAMLIAGGRVAIRERFKTEEFWSDVRATGATCACVMGAMAGFLMATDPQPDDADTTLDKILLLPLPPYVNEFADRFGLRIHTIYNQTEISCPIASDGFTVGHYTSCGRVRDGYECRVVDEDDYPVAVGEVGELVIRADRPWTMMSGYVGLPEKTVEAWRNQWMHTGDAFRVDAEGNYYFVDRFKDVIRRRGENISSVEVEEAVCDHPEIRECAAIPVPSEWTEEEVKVVVVRATGSTLTGQELVDFLLPRVPRFMVPRYVEFVGELPKTPTQKIRKAELRALGITDDTWDREASRASTRPAASA
ncbi:MAG: putative crotonobetaine/carnitine-CoA ligase [Conexibacter sp.]|jgi:crotonobetaine/carnitine-CoA ligase|nr:putative crotonobetaine/carnitine-CoA ligase [Conexibacter sp.]